jgi:hypothetical protein
MASSSTAGAPVAAAQRTLAEDLRARDDAALATLLQARPDLARPTPTDTAQVASRATARHSVAAVLDDLDTWALTALTALTLLDQPARLADVSRMVGAGEPVARAAVGRLRALALAWGPDDELRTVRVAAEVLGPHRAGLGPSSQHSAVAPSRRAHVGGQDRRGDRAGSRVCSRGCSGGRRPARSPLTARCCGSWPTSLRRACWPRLTRRRWCSLVRWACTCAAAF